MNKKISDINQAMRICFKNNARVFPTVQNGIIKLRENVNGRQYTHKENYNTSTINSALENRYKEIAAKL